MCMLLLFASRTLQGVKMNSGFSPTALLSSTSHHYSNRRAELSVGCRRKRQQRATFIRGITIFKGSFEKETKEKIIVWGEVLGVHITPTMWKPSSGLIDH